MFKGSTFATLFLTILFSSTASGEETVGSKPTSGVSFCDVWVGVMKYAEGRYETNTPIKETKTIPLNLPDGGPYFGWGFIQPCSSASESCTVKYTLFPPTEDFGQETGPNAVIDRERQSPPGGLQIFFGFDRNDFYGAYRLVVKRDGVTTCDTVISVVK